MDFFEEKNSEDKQTNEYTNIFKGKNVIVIHAESLQSIAINKEFDGVEVTPNLNKLLKEGIYFNNFYSQVGVGTSSDAEFTFATSLMPSSSGTVFINYYDREYDTIQKEFKKQDYNVYSMHGNKGTFWNRDIMHQNMGYDNFFSEESYVIDETIGLGLSDKSFFKQSIQKQENTHRGSRSHRGGCPAAHLPAETARERFAGRGGSDGLGGSTGNSLQIRHPRRQV